ncbi:MAG: trans-sulfuration enzyme family protein [Flavobacteriaceae bacterium]|tara:strand:- start:2435 stop:3574 length:1140 start_codon:yes stop_codon:yes gene_type:complete
MSKKIGTKCVHSGNIVDDKFHGSISPIYPATTYDYRKTDTYPRYFNTPNQLALSRKISDLESAEDSILFGSGLGAVSSTMFSFLKSGDHVILHDSIYGGTINLVNTEFKKFNIDFSYIDINDVDLLKSTIKKNTRIIYFETPTNPLLQIVDISLISSVAKENDIISIIDNTFASPINQNPINFGIDLVIHSATKYLGGHSDILAGSVSGTTEHIEKIKKSGINYGANLSDYTVWLLERSIKTLSVRVNAQNQNALDLANFLDESPLIKKVYYPGLKNHLSHEIASRQMIGFGGMMSFEVIDKINSEDFVSDLKIISPTMSLAGVESSITSPSKTSHKKVDPQIRKKLGISDNLLRFSVGIEDIEDLMLDLDKSLKNNVR